ncbi:MAG TPA: multiheme c-type cytochrome [Planctomycetaceae bacterium]|nr:multiheme c-type cytochrome [Planctomycetaceae bacterium]
MALSKWHWMRSGRKASTNTRVAVVVLGLMLAAVIVGRAQQPPGQPPGQPQTAGDVHKALFAENRFPSATTCAPCHEDIYREWSVSPHAYAQLSPVFNAMHATILKRTNGTNGDFCIRCHTPVGMNLKEPEFMSNLDRHPTSREGVTCIVCHRLDQAYGKISGRLPIVEGDLFGGVFGPSGNAELMRTLGRSEYNMNAEPGKPGRAVHADAAELPQISTSAFCGVCHDVTLVNGFRLEEAFSDYKHSPAAGKRIRCQDCHMGKEPGIPSGFAIGPAARVGGVDTAPRTRSNHMFAGPDYSIVHPGIFPHNTEAQALASLREWLEFDYKAGWGTAAFEDRPRPPGFEFPARWREPDDRADAADIIRNNTALLDEIAAQRLKLLQVGYQLGEIRVERADSRGVKFKVQFKNGTDGHSVPTGFDAERLVWLHVVVADARGRVVFESGDLDPNGDVRDSHSVYVHNGKLPVDPFLFSLQSRFMVTMVRGGEREQILTIPFSPDPLPFLRPSTQSTILLGRPTGARKHRQVIPPLGSNWPEYSVSGKALEGSTGPYTATIRLKAAMVPVNLVNEIKGVGFDYGMSPREVAQAVVDGHQLLWERTITLGTGPAPAAPAATVDQAAPIDPRVESGPSPGAAHGQPEPPHATDDPATMAEKAAAVGVSEALQAVVDESRITDLKLPLQLDGFPKRPKPLLELGPPFLGTGHIGKGFTIPGGAVWTPSFLMFGTLRSGVSVIDTPARRTTQWANRLDLFGNLYLSFSERVVFGLRPTDETDPGGTRRFTGYVSSTPASPAVPNGSINHFNFGSRTVSAFFFEGDLGELFPVFDLDDAKGLDIGFSVGRQAINFQEGLLINDTIDAIGLTQANFKPGSSVNFRATALFGWNEINRHTPSALPLLQNSEADSGRLLGLFTELETRRTTTQFDLVYVGGDQFQYPCSITSPGCTGTRTVAATDGVYGGAGIIGRPGGGRVNVALRVVGSAPVGDDPGETPDPVASPATRGALAVGELSWTPHHSENFFYVNTFLALGRYRAAALDPTVPGPLARVGILFAGPGLGNVPGALSAAANNAAGGAVGHQMFFGHTRQQLLLEVGGRYSTQVCAVMQTCDAHAVAATARYQAAFGRRTVFVLDGFGARDLFRGGVGGGATRVGGRAELLVKF